MRKRAACFAPRETEDVLALRRLPPYGSAIDITYHGMDKSTNVTRHLLLAHPPNPNHEDYKNFPKQRARNHFLNNFEKEQPH